MATTGPATWPGATTWPDTTVYPGQDVVQYVRCLIALADINVATTTWIDASADLQGWATSRGRTTELDQFDAGTATITLDNRGHEYDPILAAGLYPGAATWPGTSVWPGAGENVRPMNRVWIYSEFSGETHDLFKGYAEAWQQTWPGRGWSNIITAVRA